MTHNPQEFIDLGGGLGFPSTEPIAQLFSVPERTELAVNTYQALGMVPDTGKATEVIGQQMQVLHDALSIAPSPAVPVETFKPVNFVGSFTRQALVTAYDHMRRKDGSTSPKTYVFDELWDQYDQEPDALNRRSFDGTDQPAAHQARAMLLGGDKADGLRLTGLKLSDQISGAKAFVAGYDQQYPRSNAVAMNTADIVIVNAQRQVEGRPLLDNENDGTFTRIPQLEMKSVDGGSFVGNVRSSRGQLRLFGSRGLAYSGDGVRFSVGPKPEAFDL